MTDGKGQFALKDLAPELVFRLLAVVEGYTPALLPGRADPATGRPVTFTLTPHDLDRRAPALVLKGRVLDENSAPVAHAVIEPFGFSKGKGTQFGGVKGFDPLALTNEKGEFRLGVPEPGIGVYVQVNAPVLAPRKFSKLASGPRSHELTLFAGVTITGRLVKGGKPLAGVAVGAAQKNRRTDTFLGDFQAATDARGIFQIRNVPPEEALNVYGLMDSLRKHGAFALRNVRTGKSGTVSDVGDLEVKAGHTLSGRVVLADGKPVPPGTRVMLSREEAWDRQQVVVDREGRFTLTGLPSERYSLTAEVRGYHLSPRNVSRDVVVPFQLVGAVRADIVGLNLLLEPGPQPEVPYNWDAKDWEAYRRKRDTPLRGAPTEKQPR